MKRNEHFVINHINHKSKPDLIHFTDMNDLDKKIITDTHKPVKRLIHQPTSSDYGSPELCA